MDIYATSYRNEYRCSNQNNFPPLSYFLAVFLVSAGLAWVVVAVGLAVVAGAFLSSFLAGAPFLSSFLAGAFLSSFLGAAAFFSAGFSPLLRAAFSDPALVAAANLFFLSSRRSFLYSALALVVFFQPSTLSV
jgi:hypothetical protein